MNNKKKGVILKRFNVILKSFQDPTNNKNKLILIFGAIIIVSLGLNAYLADKISQSPPDTHQVLKVFDGDFFSIPPDQSVRLAFLDAPAIDLCYGQEAKEGLENLIAGKNVKIKKITKDHYGRTVALVYSGNRLVNREILANGWAKYDSQSASKELKEVIEQLKAVNQKAKENQIGIWSEQCYQKENKQNPACNIKGNISTHNGDKIYHYPGCNHYEQTIVELNTGEQWFCSEKEAVEAGFTKSEHCFINYQKPKSPSSPSS